MIPAPLLYWFPGRIDPAPGYAKRFQGADGEDKGCFSRNSMGPEEGVRGCLASPMHSVFASYVPATQRWDRLSPEVWIGATKGATPDLFARPRQYNGYRRTLGDGNEWVIPIANPFARLCSLPAHDVLRDGAWVREIAERYRDLSDRSAALSEQVRTAVADGREGDGIDMPDADLRQLFANVLALNYDLTLEEMSALRLFDPSVYWPVVSAFIDWEGIRQAMRDAMEGGQQAAGPFGGSAPPVTSATPTTAPAGAGTV